MSKYRIIAPIFLIGLLVSLLLQGCVSQESFEQAQTNVFASEAKIDAAHKEQLKPLPAVVSQPGPYVDTTPISLERPPAWLSRRISIHGNDLPFAFYIAKMMVGTGVMVHYQEELDEKKLMSMSYKGSLKGALELLQSKSGYDFEVGKKRLTWNALITKTFNISFMPGSTDYLIGRKQSMGSAGASVSGGSGGATIQQVSAQNADDEYSNITGQLS